MTSRVLVIALCLITALVPSVAQYKSGFYTSGIVTACCDLGEFGTAGGHIFFSQWIEGGPTYISGTSLHRPNRLLDMLSYVRLHHQCHPRIAWMARP